MKLSLKSKIWFTVLSIVLMFAFFILIYFPEQQEKHLLHNYNNEVQNLAATVALGVKIALTEQNFEGVETAMDFVKKKENLRFVSLLTVDTTYDAQGKLHLTRAVFKTYPEKFPVDINAESNDSMIVKISSFATPLMNGEIMLGFSTQEITKSKQQIRITSLLVCLVVFAIGILIGFVLAKNISIPVLALRDAALKVGEGDRTQRVNPRGKDEIGQLTHAFNKMVEDLEKAESERKVAQDLLIQSEKMASLGQMTAGIAHEIKNPLNFVNNFSQLSTELIQEIEESTDEEEKAELFGDLKSNLNKINHHGKRADSIVATMLQHSRGTAGTKVPTDLNKLMDEYADLAFHGTRATIQDFNCTITKHFDSALPHVNVIPQELSRVFLNLLNNAFYAVAERVEKNPGSAKPEVVITTQLVEGKAVLKIKDNGSGIPTEIKDKIFEPFFTTKPAGKGTGLGLSLSFDIVTKEHQGMMSVNSEKGVYTEFVITLPV